MLIILRPLLLRTSFASPADRHGSCGVLRGSPEKCRTRVGTGHCDADVARSRAGWP
jgi:hypothetical protein